MPVRALDSHRGGLRRAAWTSRSIRSKSAFSSASMPGVRGVLAPGKRDELRSLSTSRLRRISMCRSDAVHPMRAHHLCAALGLSTDKSKVGASGGS